MYQTVKNRVLQKDIVIALLMFLTNMAPSLAILTNMAPSLARQLGLAHNSKQTSADVLNYFSKGSECREWSEEDNRSYYGFHVFIEGLSEKPMYKTALRQTITKVSK